MALRMPTAIDPAALWLPNDVYVDLNKPYPPPVEIKARFAQLVKRMTTEQKAQTREHLQAMQSLVRELQDELGVEAKRPEMRARA